MPSDPPVVLVHSSGLSSRQWSRWDLGPRRTLAPDLWGCGTRGPWPGPWPFGLRADLDLLLATLDERGPADVVGHSYGGALALYAAIERPERVRAVVAYEPPLTGLLGGFRPEALPPGFTDPAGEGSEPWLAAFVEWWNGPGAWDALADPVRASLVRAGREVWGQVMDLLADPRPLEAYAALPPTLLLRGDPTPPPVAAALERLATLPQVQLERLPGLGHMGPLVAPERVSRGVREWLAAGARAARATPASSASTSHES